MARTDKSLESHESGALICIHPSVKERVKNSFYFITGRYYFEYGTVCVMVL